jgi:CcmD family protein
MTFLVAGMMVFWLATFFFVWSISRRQHKLEEELAVLREVVAEGSVGQA